MRDLVSAHDLDGLIPRRCGRTLDQMIEPAGDKALLSVVFEAAPVGLMAVDKAGLICAANSHLDEMFGYSRDELIGRHVSILVPERFRTRHACLLQSFTATPEPRPMGAGRDLFGARRDGVEFPIEVGLRHAATENGSIVVVSVVDISARQRAAAESGLLERAQERLEECRQLGLPAAVLRHDGKMLLQNCLLTGLGGPFVTTGGRFELADRAAHHLYTRALACLDEGRSDEILHSIPVAAAGDFAPFVLHLLPMKCPLGSELAVLVVTTLRAAGTASIELVRGLFGLTVAEAKVATLIGVGRPISEVAQTLGISEGNARTTLKHVFMKVGVSRQAELAVILTQLTR